MKRDIGGKWKKQSIREFLGILYSFSVIAVGHRYKHGKLISTVDQINT